jgi:hypothetical protein
MRAGEKTRMHLCETLNKETDEKVQLFKDNGVVIDKFTKDEVEAWKTATKGVIANWVKEYEARGLPAQQVVDALDKTASELPE